MKLFFFFTLLVACMIARAKSIAPSHQPTGREFPPGMELLPPFPRIQKKTPPRASDALYKLLYTNHSYNNTVVYYSIYFYHKSRWNSGCPIACRHFSPTKINASTGSDTAKLIKAKAIQAFWKPTSVPSFTA